MARHCAFCTHPKKGELENKLLRGEISQKNVAKTLGVTRQAVSNHMRNHVYKPVARIQEKGELKKGFDAATVFSKALDDMQDNLTEAKDLLQDAKRHSNRVDALNAVGKITKCQELLLRVIAPLAVDILEVEKDKDREIIVDIEEEDLND